MLVIWLRTTDGQSQVTKAKLVRHLKTEEERRKKNIAFAWNLLFTIICEIPRAACTSDFYITANEIWSGFIDDCFFFFKLSSTWLIRDIIPTRKLSRIKTTDTNRIKKMERKRKRSKRTSWIETDFQCNGSGIFRARQNMSRVSLILLCLPLALTFQCESFMNQYWKPFMGIFVWDWDSATNTVLYLV